VLFVPRGLATTCVRKILKGYINMFAASKSLRIGLVCACVLNVIIQQAGAQDASKYYTVQHPEQFKIDWGSFYKQADAMTSTVRAEFPHKLDLPYGKNAKQRLDLYFPKDAPKNAPVFIFLHGGGFREGDRAQYGFVAKPFSEQGVITVVASYRLTGDGFKYPDQPQDARQAFIWVYKHIAQYGGDPRRIYVGGHSAGAILSADIGVNRGWMKAAGIPAEVFRGMIPISGPYDLRTPGRKGEGDVYAGTAVLQAAASPVLHISNPVPVSLIAVGSTETYVASSEELTNKLKAAGAQATFMSLEGEDHRGTVHDLGDSNSLLAKAALKMILSSAPGN
jgi:acetyl esterase/lipase